MYMRPHYILPLGGFMYSSELFHFLTNEVLPIVGCFLVPAGMAFFLNAFVHFLLCLKEAFPPRGGDKNV